MFSTSNKRFFKDDDDDDDDDTFEAEGKKKFVIHQILALAFYDMHVNNALVLKTEDSRLKRDTFFSRGIAVRILLASIFDYLKLA